MIVAVAHYESLLHCSQSVVCHYAIMVGACVREGHMQQLAIHY